MAEEVSSCLSKDVIPNWILSMYVHTHRHTLYATYPENFIMQSIVNVKTYLLKELITNACWILISKQDTYAFLSEARWSLQNRL